MLLAPMVFALFFSNEIKDSQFICVHSDTMFFKKSFVTKVGLMHFKFGHSISFFLPFSFIQFSFLLSFLFLFGYSIINGSCNEIRTVALP